MFSRRNKVIERIKEIIEKEIKPALQAEGGFIELVKVEDGNVYVKMGGACAGCPMSMYTLKNFVESSIREKVPEVKEVISTE